MTDPAHTDRIIVQGKALVRAIEAVGTIEPTGPIERALARLLQAAWCVVLVLVGQQVGQWLQTQNLAVVILSLAVVVAGGAVAWRWVGSITQREVR